MVELLTQISLTCRESNKAASILLYHVVPVAALSTQLSDMQVLPTLLGKNLTVSLMGGMVNIIAQESNATVVTADVAVCGSVVHIINHVLIPAALADIPNYMPPTPTTPTTPPAAMTPPAAGSPPGTPPTLASPSPPGTILSPYRKWALGPISPILQLAQLFDWNFVNMTVYLTLHRLQILILCVSGPDNGAMKASSSVAMGVVAAALGIFVALA